MKPEGVVKIKEEIIKQLETDFLEVIDYLEWFSHIISVPKKDEKVRMCVDYRDLSKGAPKMTSHYHRWMFSSITLRACSVLFYGWFLWL